MGNGIGKLRNVNIDEQLVIEDCTGRTLVDGPVMFQSYSLFSVGRKVKQIELKLNEYVLITNEIEPIKNRYIFGPDIARLSTPWEYFGNKQKCIILDQDDYIVISSPNGEKRTIKGPGVYKPVYGETWTNTSNAIIVPPNHYIVIKDNNDKTNPIKHIRGPTKFIPEPYQTFVKNGTTELYQCLEITELKGIHLQKADGNIILMDKPMFYMLDVGEKIIKTIDKTVMIASDFCIIKGPDGKTFILDGKDELNRSFFLRPFYEFIGFNIGSEVKYILSILPTFISHKFTIRTNDNVLLDIDLRISYQIFDVKIFGSNPLNFYQHLINWCQNELLDLFAKLTLRDFMKSYSSVALQSITNGTEYFKNFGIQILDIQIINYLCQDKNTQELLNKDIQTHVNKQNELKAKEADILIKEKENIIGQKQKDMEVEMTKKDIEVELKKKEMNVKIAEKDNEIEMKKKELEIGIRMKEIDLQIEEETKRTKLLDIKRHNAVKEGEFEGKAQGSSVNEFLKTIENIKPEEKLEIWNKLRDLEKASMLYSKVGQFNIYPPNADFKVFQLENTQLVNETKDSIVRNIAMPDILMYNQGKK
jgi:hypothetical protein